MKADVQAPAVAGEGPALARYDLDLDDGGHRALGRAWLHLGLFALVGSGLFALLLVLTRTPGVNRWLPAGDFFRVALVVHVDLSVLVWFASMAGMLWSLAGQARLLRLGWIALGLGVSGTAIMALAPFLQQAAPVMANYIPVLDGPVFLGGLLVFAAGGALLVLRHAFVAPRPGAVPAAAGALLFGLNASAIAAAIALVAFAWSYLVMPGGLDGKAYYEILFWGGGHALQFVWTLLMLVCWLWLAGATGLHLAMSPRLAAAMFALALASTAVTPYAYLAHDIATVEHRDLHTWAMRFGGGAAIAPVLLALVLSRRPGGAMEPALRPLRAALWASAALFVAGGLIGLSISGNNVKIPAHYHGSIVGVTLALMGIVYHLLPRLGYARPVGRMANWQPWIYGGGQLMHIVGLVWSGGYGVQRKVAGAEQVLRTPGEIAGMGLMGMGGLVAIVGGLLFVIVAARAMRSAGATPTVGGTR